VAVVVGEVPALPRGDAPPVVGGVVEELAAMSLARDDVGVDGRGVAEFAASLTVRLREMSPTSTEEAALDWSAWQLASITTPVKV